MSLPIWFPSEGDVIREETSRFRALSPEERIRMIRGLINTGGMLANRSPEAEFMRAYTDEQERLARQAVKDVIARGVRYALIGDLATMLGADRGLLRTRTFCLRCPKPNCPTYSTT